MKIWITARFDDAGVEECETVADPANGCFQVYRKGGIWTYNHWREGEFWHRSKEKAVATAAKYRAERLRDATERAARIASLPEMKSEAA